VSFRCAGVFVQDAEMAIASMNGQWIGGRAIRTNWANGKANANATRGNENRQCKLPKFFHSLARVYDRVVKLYLSSD